MDYISREKLRHAMYHEAFETDTELQKWESGCWIRYRLFTDVLDALPAADVEERKTGKWEIIDEVEPRRYGCSNCKRMVWHIENFCPNCGAELREG